MSDFREKFSLLQGKPMHAVVEARSMFRAVPRGPDEPKGLWLERAGRFFGLTRSQAKKIEYDEVKDMRASRLLDMREKLNQLQQGAIKRQELLNGLQILRSGNGSADLPGGRDGVEPADRRGNRTDEGGV